MERDALKIFIEFMMFFTIVEIFWGIKIVAKLVTFSWNTCRVMGKAILSFFNQLNLYILIVCCFTLIRIHETIYTINITIILLTGLLAMCLFLILSLIILYSMTKIIEERIFTHTLKETKEEGTVCGDHTAIVDL